VRRWRELVTDRKKWKDIFRQAKANVMPMEEEEEEEEDIGKMSFTTYRNNNNKKISRKVFMSESLR
jgi:hypothetical protein